MDFGRRVGHEQDSARPAVVVSNDSFNRHSRRLTVCPCSSTPRAARISEVEIAAPAGGLEKRSLVLVDQVVTVSVLRVAGKRGHVHDPVMQRMIEAALQTHLALPGALT